MRWSQIALRQSGTISRAQLRGAGLTDAVIDRMLRQEEVIPILPGVYRAAPVPMTEPVATWAAVLWSAGVASHWSAARVWQLHVDRPEWTHVSVPDGRYRGRPARRAGGVKVKVHRVHLDRARCLQREGLPVTDRARTVVDLIGCLPLPQGRGLLDRSLQNHWVTLADLDKRLVDEPGRTGNVKIRRLRQEAVPGAQAEFERRVQALLRGGGLFGWVAQYSLVVPSGQVIRIDLAFPDRRVAIELDGWAHHNQLPAFRSDRRRGNALVLLGWTLLRFTWDDLAHPQRILDEIEQALASAVGQSLRDQRAAWPARGGS